jgi:hypothetical protein
LSTEFTRCCLTSATGGSTVPAVDVWVCSEVGWTEWRWTMVDGEVVVRTGRSVRDKVWRTKDGRRIPLREMGDQHLMNTMVYLRRAHQRYVESIVFLGIPVDIGDCARDAAEEEMVNALESKVEEFFPIYDDLMTEAIRRGLVK